MGLKQLLIVFQKFVQNTQSREQRLMDGKKNARKRGRSSLVNDEMVKKIKDVIIGSHLADKVSSRKMVFVIGTGVVKTDEPKILEEI